MLKAIVAVDKNFGIGKDGKLLAYIKEDLKYFKETTIESTVILGRKTLYTFPNKKPLPLRKNIILSRNKDLKIENALICNSKEEVFEKIKDDKNVFIIGGEEIYKLFFEDLEEIYVTKIDSIFDADAFFVNLDNDKNFKIIKESEFIITESGYRIKFLIYRKIK